MFKRSIKGVSDEAKLKIADDKFKIQNYVEGLSQFISVCETPMTISIQGDWGSGKTSFMNMVKEKLPPESTYSIELNTWQFSQFNFGEKLPLLVMSKMLKELGAKEDTDIRKYMHIILELTEVSSIPVLSGTAALFKKYFGDKNEEDLTDLIVKLKESFQDVVNEKIGMKPTMGDKKEESQSRHRVVVFIDDLDRLPPVKALELLEVLKIFLDCKHVVFVLAIDYEVIVQGVYEKYRLDQEKGKKFFDKIIQLPFKMPISQYDIHEFLKSSFKDVGVELENESVVERYHKLIANSIQFNPRAMKRLFNSFQLLLIMKEKNAVNKIHNHELILFMGLCMQIAYEELYNFISAPRKRFEAEKLLDTIANLLINGSDGTYSDNLEESSPQEVIMEELFKLDLISEETHKGALLNFLEIFLASLAEDPEDLSTLKVDGLFEIFKATALTQRTDNEQGTKNVRAIGTFSTPQLLPINAIGTSNEVLKKWDGSKVHFLTLGGEKIPVKNHTDAFAKALGYLYQRDQRAFSDMMDEAKKNAQMDVIRAIFFETKQGKPLNGMTSIQNIEEDIQVGTHTNTWYKIAQLLAVCDYLGVNPENIKYQVSLMERN